MPKPPTISNGYPALRKRVEETLLHGQRKIEEAKVQTYWRTGKLINEHLKGHESRADHYGEQVIAKLSEDLKISRDVLWRCIQFANAFKILVAPRESLLTWTHYLKLITVRDEQTRVSLMKRATKSHWTSDELAQKINQEVKDDLFKGVERGSTLSSSASKKLIPRQGKLYTYRLLELDPLHKKFKDIGPRIDLGFKAHQQLPDSAKNFKAGQIIETLKNEKDDYGVRASNRKEADLFTFKAYVERVVDGDTLYVDVDLGFKTGVLQYLRLRGIDAPEIDTPEGKKARDFVVRELAKVPYIILTSSRSDKYDRYLADVFYLPLKNSREDKRNAPASPERASRGVWFGEGEDEKYLNQVLLDEGLAQRWE